MVSTNKKVKFREILVILLLPMITSTIGKLIEYYREKRIKNQFPYEILLTMESLVAGSTYTPKRAIIEELEHFSNDPLTIESKNANNITNPALDKSRMANLLTEKCHFTFTFTKESIENYKKVYSAFDLSILDFDDLLNKTILVIIDEKGPRILGNKMDYLEQFLKIIITSKNLVQEKKKDPVYYEVSNKDKGNGSPLLYKRGLKKIFLNEKSQIIDRLTQWQKQKQFYKSRDLPYKLGLMFYGLPGSGKTSLSYAIAAHFEYNFFRVEIVDTCYDWIFDMMKNNSRSVFLFDEFDRILEHLTWLREKEEKSDKEDEDIKIPKKEVAKKIVKNYKIDFVEKLMKCLEDIRLQEVIIIFTTNRAPEDFEAALIRPGRIDYTEYFGNCSIPQFHKIYQDYVGSEPPEFKGDISPARLINQILVPFHDQPNKILELLNR